MDRITLKTEEEKMKIFCQIAGALLVASLASWMSPPVFVGPPAKELPVRFEEVAESSRFKPEAGNPPPAATPRTERSRKYPS